MTIRRILLLALLGGGSTPLAAGCASPRPAPVPESLPTFQSPPERGTPKPLPGPIQALTLERAARIAEDSHPELASARARIESAEGRVLQAGLLPNPELVARMEVAPLREGTVDQAEYVAGISQRVPIGGRLGAAVLAEERERDRLLKELEARRLEVRGRVHAAFAAALHAEEAARVQSDQLRIASNGVAVTKARQAAGDALPEDVARVELEELRARLEHERARSLRDAAFVALSASLGDSSLRIESVAGALEAALELPALEALVAALEGHPLVEAAAAGIAVERAREELARAQRVPDVNLELFYRRQEASRTDAFDAGIAIAIPLFDRNQGRLLEARAATAGAEAGHRATKNELHRQAREAHLRLSRALSHARLLREEVLPRADLVLRGAETRHAGGDLSLSDLLPVRRDRGAVRLMYLESLRDAMEAWAAIRPFLAD